MKAEHEEFFREIPGQAYCYLCSRAFDSHIACAWHIESNHPDVWASMIIVSDEIDKLHEQMVPIEERVLEDTKKLMELQNQVNSLLKKIPRILEETRHISSRN